MYICIYICMYICVCIYMSRSVRDRRRGLCAKARAAVCEGGASAVALLKLLVYEALSC